MRGSFVLRLGGADGAVPASTKSFGRWTTISLSSFRARAWATNSAGFSGRIIAQLASAVVHDPVVETIVRDDVKGGGAIGLNHCYNPNG